MRYRPLVFLLAAALFGCAGPKSKVLDDNGEFTHHKCIGVAPFADARGQGQAVADAVESGLQQLMYEPVDQKVLAQVLATNKPEHGSNLGIEAIENIHSKIPVDAIIFGRISPDWSTVSVTMVEMDMGAPILSAVLRPRGRNKAAFADANDIARELLRVLTTLR